MLLITYDISDDKKRTRFSKFLKQYGNRVQYSVFRMKNSKRLLNIVTSKIRTDLSENFGPEDSVYVFSVCDGCNKKIFKCGRAVYEDKDVIYFGE